MKIEILGAEGCQKCSNLKEKVEAVVSDLEGGEDIEVKKVNDPVKVAEYGVVSTPGLVVDGEVEFAGKAPPKRELERILS